MKSQAARAVAPGRTTTIGQDALLKGSDRLASLSERPITINAPDTPAPVVTFDKGAVQVSVKAPAVTTPITVNVPDPPAPVVTVAPPVVTLNATIPSEFDVNVRSMPPSTRTVERDSAERITKVHEE